LVVIPVAWVVTTAAVVLALRWAPPPMTAFMIQHRLTQAFESRSRPSRVQYLWTPWKNISTHLALAAVAAEDQKFPHHFGFDLEAIQQALEVKKHRGFLRGASTITQQTAKNLFLWSGRSFVRKGLEAYFAMLIELLWSKKRILEVYLNVIEFGDGIYGVGAAGKRFFNKSPDRINRQEAALLAAVLPNPKRFKVDRPSAYVRRRQAWILMQMRLLGGSSTIEEIATP